MLKEFIQNFQSTVISTIDKENLPFTSYSPIIENEQKFYFFISDIAKHAQNIKHFPNISLFFIEDEQNCNNIFARKRVVYQGKAKKIQRNNKLFETLIKQLEEKHGKTVNILKQMQDFNLYEITILKGEAVFGFGKAYDIHTEDIYTLVERKANMGHK